MSLPASEATPTETPDGARSGAEGGAAGGPASGTVSSAGEGTGRLTRTGPLVWLVMVAGAAVLLYIASRHAFAGNSDGATVILQGQAVLHGDLGLSGWALSLDSFWTVDVPFYVVGVAINGVGPALYHAMPAVIAALVIGVGMVLARAKRTERASYTGSLTVFAFLALPGIFLANFLVQGPLHLGTTLWCLLAFLGLRKGRFGWGWGLALLMLTAGLLGDFQTAVMGVAPVVVGGVVAGVRLRSVRGALPAVTAGLGSLVAAEAVRKIMDKVGTYSIGSANPTASRDQMLHNVGNAASWGAEMIGLKSSGTVPWDRDLHVLVAALLAVAIVAAIVWGVWGIISGKATSIGRADWRIDDFLVLAVAGDFVMFLYLTPLNNFNYVRYLTAALVFGSILAGRLVTRWVTRSPDRRPGPSRLAPFVAAIAVVVTALFGVGFAHSVRGPAVTAPSVGLIHFLTARHLHQGIGDYWDASSVTVQSGDTIRIRPVVEDPNGKLGRYERQSSASWYRGKAFQFLVFNGASSFDGVDLASARATFGTPSHVYAVDTYRVVVWDGPVRVSP